MLRHLIGLLAGVALAPALWSGLAWSAQRVSATVAEDGGFDAPLTMTAVGVLMAVGVACGFLAGARVSPLAAFCCGGLVLSYALWPVLAPGTVDSALPGWITDDSVLHPLGDVLLLALPLGTLLFISSLAPSRWRSRRAAEAGPAAPQQADPADSAPGPRAEYLPERPAEPAPPAGPAAPPATGMPEQGDPDKTTTPMRRRNIGRPRWRAKAPEPQSDTLEFQRDERR
ncbi:hypothetical protein [Streptomonospora wellingtoniae]|uniref:Uncharacterized protein n=1 Tax=Streptomonospora wellingtoniae TaxID=3075544 RepID=A0ABU2KZ92_9ACTN|nr:hypothetical protein [Streptomonospora sp. DSM 45055]MDT0304572.1 hypothetical protein [Streptomonospora sp. DSM 45055]